MGKHSQSKKWKFYVVENGELKRIRPFCPRCGPGVFMADHGDRYYCGRCGYTVKKESKE